VGQAALLVVPVGLRYQYPPQYQLPITKQSVAVAVAVVEVTPGLQTSLTRGQSFT
jgi:hypothetical protein